jgi:putative intracellular protease/amidase
MLKKYLFAIFLMLAACQVFAVSKNIKVLFLLSNTNYGPNYYLTRDDMEEYGYEVTVAGVTRTLSRCALFGGLPSITVDTLISEIGKITDFNVLAIGPASWRAGDAYRDMLSDPNTLRLIKAAADSGLVIWATCGGVRVLAAAGVLRGKKVIGAETYKTEYLAAGATYFGADHAPMIDGNIITCVRDQYYHVQNCEAISYVLQNVLLQRAKGGVK